MINASDTVTAVNIKCKYVYVIFILTHVSQISGFVQSEAALGVRGA